MLLKNTTTGNIAEYKNMSQEDINALNVLNTDILEIPSQSEIDTYNFCSLKIQKEKEVTETCRLKLKDGYVYKGVTFSILKSDVTELSTKLGRIEKYGINEGNYTWYSIDSGIINFLTLDEFRIFASIIVGYSEEVDFQSKNLVNQITQCADGDQTSLDLINTSIVLGNETPVPPLLTLEEAQEEARSELAENCLRYTLAEVVIPRDIYNSAMNVFPGEACELDRQRRNAQRVRQTKYRDIKSQIFQAATIQGIPTWEKSDFEIPLNEKWFLAYRNNNNCFYFGQNYIKPEAIRRFEDDQITECCSLALERLARKNIGANGKFEVLPVIGDYSIVCVDSLTVASQSMEEYLKEKLDLGLVITDFNFDDQTNELTLDETNNLQDTKDKKILELKEAWDAEYKVQYPCIDRFTIMRGTCGKTAQDLTDMDAFVENLYTTKYSPKKTTVNSAVTKSDVVAVTWE